MTTPMVEEKTTDDALVVTQLNFNDVLFGRGAPAIDNEGNVRFRRVVCSRRTEYIAAAKRQTKDQIAREVVQTIQAEGGRFLKKMNQPENSLEPGLAEKTNAWKVVELGEVLTKVKQALRERSQENVGEQRRKRKRVHRGNLVPLDECRHDQVGKVAQLGQNLTTISAQNLLLRSLLRDSAHYSDIQREMLRNCNRSQAFSTKPSISGNQVHAVLNTFLGHQSTNSISNGAICAPLHLPAILHGRQSTMDPSETLFSGLDSQLPLDSSILSLLRSKGGPSWNHATNETSNFYTRNLFH